MLPSRLFRLLVQPDPNAGQPRWTGRGIAEGDDRGGSPHPTFDDEGGKASDGFEDLLVRFGIAFQGHAVALL
jgi:hypothetical protein